VYLKAIREARGLTQHQLAVTIGLSGGTHISQYETVQRRPSYPTLGRLAKALDIEPELLLAAEYRAGHKARCRGEKVPPGPALGGRRAAEDDWYSAIEHREVKLGRVSEGHSWGFDSGEEGSA
jgi:transcriptional regulator with XRE-family HTH domain